MVDPGKIISPGWLGSGGGGKSQNMYCVCVFFVCLLCLSVYVEKRALYLSFRTSMWQNTVFQYFTMFLCVHKAGEQIDPKE